MGYKTFYLLLSIITLSWPGDQTLIIIPESMHRCHDSHDFEGNLSPALVYTLWYTPQEAQLRESQNTTLVCQEETAWPSAQAWLMHKSLASSLPSLSRAQAIEIFHPFLLPAHPCQRRLPRDMGLDSLCHSYTTSAERVSYSSCPGPFKTLVLCSDLKEPQQGNSLIAFSSSARANLT